MPSRESRFSQVMAWLFPSCIAMRLRNVSFTAAEYTVRLPKDAPKCFYDRLRNRMNRRTRLAKGKAWAKSYAGPKIMHAYARKFKVTTLCAINDLQRFKIPMDQIDLIRLDCHFYNEAQMKKKDLEAILDRLRDPFDFEENDGNCEDEEFEDNSSKQYTDDPNEVPF